MIEMISGTTVIQVPAHMQEEMEKRGFALKNKPKPKETKTDLKIEVKENGKV